MIQLQAAFALPGSIENLFQLHDKWVPLEDAAKELGHAVVLGACLGVACPDLVEQFWQAKGTPDEMTLRIRQELGKHGLPEEYEPFPLEEFEQHTLLELTAFVRAYRPGLVAALKLTIPGAE